MIFLFQFIMLLSVSVHDKPLSEPDSANDALYASVKSRRFRGKTPESRDTEEIQYATVQHHRKTETKRAEENECQYDDIRVHQPDAAVSQDRLSLFQFQISSRQRRKK
ncbi:unnamed protein product [Leuciscus chuanchicus]